MLRTKIFFAPLMMLPVLSFFIWAYAFAPDLFASLVVYPDSEKYILMANGQHHLVNYPFRARILVPFLASLIPYLSGTHLAFFFVNTVAMFGVSVLLFLIFRLYASEKYALFGVLAHNVSYPIVYYFFAALTDTMGYLLVLVGLYLIFTKRNSYYITAVLVVGLLARETILVLLPLWIVSKWNRRERALAFMSAVLVVFFFVYQYGVGSHTSFRFPAGHWQLVIILSLVPFLPFALFWKKNNLAGIYSLSVVLLSLWAFFFAYFDGRFLVLGYPVWIGLTVQAIERKLKNWKSELAKVIEELDPREGGLSF